MTNDKSNKLNQVKYFKCYCPNHTKPGCIQLLPDACEATRDIVQAVLLVWIFMMFARTLMGWLRKTTMVRRQFKMLDGFTSVKLMILNFTTEADRAQKTLHSPENSPQYTAESQNIRKCKNVSNEFMKWRQRTSLFLCQLHYLLYQDTSQCIDMVIHYHLHDFHFFKCVGCDCNTWLSPVHQWDIDIVKQSIVAVVAKTIINTTRSHRHSTGLVTIQESI